MSSVERVVICPKCGEDNPENFKFCGMCGTTLGQKVEARRPAGAPVPNLPQVNRPLDAPVFKREPQSAETTRPAANAPARTPDSVMGGPTINGPSLLGLDRPMAAESNSGRTATATEPRQNEFGPTPDLLREKSFSGLDSFFEPEEPKGGAGRLVLFLILLVALGAAGWWTYTNYLATAGAKPAASTPASTSSTDSSAQTSTNSQDSTPQTATPAQETNPTPAANGTSASGQAGSGASENASGNAAAPASNPPATSGTAAVPSASAPVQPSAAAREEARRKAREEAEEKRQARLDAERATTKPAAAKPAAASPAANPKISDATAPVTGGDSDFRKGEAYLYGRGAAQNCGEAIRYLKSAAATQSAKARSTFGTMYATGHCVNRDLPTSYQWFAMALQLDPNNKILQEDLNAIWNQMTPPERQSATRAKQ